MWAEIVGWFQENIISPIVDAWNSIVGTVETAITKAKEFFSLDGSAAGDGATNVSNPGITPAVGADPTEEKTGSSTWWVSMPSFLAGHANGLSFVPENDYPARLHFGEAVLSRNEAEKWRKGQSGDSGAIDLSSLTNAIVVAVKQGMESANIQMDGESITKYVSRRQAEDIMARRFVVV